IQHSPVCSSEANVVSLPSLDVRALRPLSSVSSLSALSTTRLSASSRSRGSSLTLDLDTSSASGRREDSGMLKSPGVSFAASPRWARPFEGPFLPPISTPTSPAILAASSTLDISRDISPKKRVFGSASGHRLARRNSDSMAKLKEASRTSSSGVVLSATETVPSPDSASVVSHQNISPKLISADFSATVDGKALRYENKREFGSKTRGERASRDANAKGLSHHRKALRGEASESSLEQLASAPDKKHQRFIKTKNPAVRDLSYPGRRNKSHGRRRWNDNKHSLVNGAKSAMDLSVLPSKSNSRSKNLASNDMPSPLRPRNKSDALQRLSDSEKELDIVGTSLHTWTRGQQHERLSNSRRSDRKDQAAAANQVPDEASSQPVAGGNKSDTGERRKVEVADIKHLGSTAVTTDRSEDKEREVTRRFSEAKLHQGHGQCEQCGENKWNARCVEEDSGMKYLVGLDEECNMTVVDAMKDFLVYAWNKRQ
ncbi:hypothetical protein FHG87_005754, partial [Trinorchestia longiramus]